MAYQELIRSLAKAVPALKLEPMPLTSFTLTNRPEPGKDLARILGLSMAETNAFSLLPKPGLPRFTMKLSPPDHPTEPKFINNPQAQGRMIVFQDTFAMSWVSLLGYHFNQVTYLWQTIWIPFGLSETNLTSSSTKWWNAFSTPKTQKADGQGCAELKAAFDGRHCSEPIRSMSAANAAASHTAGTSTPDVAAKPDWH